MVSGVDTPVAQSPLIEASTNVVLVNQARQGTIVNSSQLVVGKQFQAEVVASLTDGTYIVKVADVAARMQLPNSPEVGSKVSLTLLSTTPRATFLLNPPGSEQSSGNGTTANAILGTTVKQLIDEFNQTAGGKAQNPVANGNPNPGTPSASTPSNGLTLQPGSAVTATNNTNAEPRLINISTPETDSAPANLSSAGKLVNQLIQNTPQQASIVNVSKVPLVSTPQATVNTMMKALQGGVANSGVFYESHLLQWAEGTLPTAELMKEPQAKFPVPTPETTTAQNNAQSTDTGKLTLPQTVANSLLGAFSKTDNAASAVSPAITLPKEATPLIQQQLQTMEQQRFVWQGELWPGQPMEWEIAQNEKDQGQGQQSGEPTWQSAVRFELPQLGSVSAQLQLTGNHLRINITAKDKTTALMLQNHAPELSNALDAAGTQLDSLLVKTNPA